MAKELKSSRAPGAIGPYSQGKEAHGFCYFSGQIPLDPKTGEMNNQSFEDECRQVMENIKVLLEDNDLGFKDLVKVNISITDMDLFASLNEIYAEYMQEPYPARACVAVASLPKGSRLEIECIAARP